MYNYKNLHAHWGCLSLTEEAGVKCSVDRKAWRRLVTFWVAASSDSDSLICQCYFISLVGHDLSLHGIRAVQSFGLALKKKKQTTIIFADELWFQRSLFLCTKSFIAVILPWFGVNSGTIQNWGLNYGQRVEFYSGFSEALGQQLLITWIILSWVGSVIEVEGDFFFSSQKWFCKSFSELIDTHLSWIQNILWNRMTVIFDPRNQS